MRVLTEQVKAMSERGPGGRKWDHLENYKNLKLFDGKQHDFEEWNMKFRSIVCAGDRKVGQLMKSVESECTEDELTKGKFLQLVPEFDQTDEAFIMETSATMFNVLLNVTTGEANAVVRRSNGMGWLAWKRLMSSLNPRTLASGIKAISAVLTPQKVSSALKADHALDEWEDKLLKLNTEYGQDVTNKVKVAVLYGMMPKDLQEKILDECAVNWDQNSEGQAADLLTKIKSNVRNVAKARREMTGPRPMEVDRVSAWEEWGGDWGVENEAEENGEDEKGEYDIRYVGQEGARREEKGSKEIATSAASSATPSGTAARAKAREKATARATARTTPTTRATARTTPTTRATAKDTARTAPTARASARTVVRAECPGHASAAARRSTC